MANIDKQIKASDRQVQALEMRKLGQSFTSIAKELNFHDASGARKAVYRALKKVTQVPAEGLIRIQMERLEMLLSKHMPSAINGDLKATEIVMKIIYQECKMVGIEQPQTRIDRDIDPLFTQIFHPGRRSTEQTETVSVFSDLLKSINR